MKISARIAVCVMVTIIIFSAVPGFCGFVFTEFDGTKSYVSRGKIKVMVGNEMIDDMILDYNENLLIVINHSMKSASTYTLDGYCEMAKKRNDEMFEICMEVEVGTAPEVRIEKRGKGDDIAGYPTVKYDVYSNGELWEEAWICMDNKFSGEIGDMDQYARFEKCAALCGNLLNPVEASDEYQQLIKLGWLLKSIDHTSAPPSVVVDIQKIETREIPDSEFAIPEGYQVTAQ